MKRWVAYHRQRGQDSRPLFLIEAETEREALCLASDAALSLEAERALSASGGGGPWVGPMVHVRLADEVPAADLAFAVGKLATTN